MIAKAKKDDKNELKILSCPISMKWRVGCKILEDNKKHLMLRAVHWRRPASKQHNKHVDKLEDVAHGLENQLLRL